MKKAIVIAATGYSTPQQIAFNEVGRKAIISDPDWNNGNYYDTKSYDAPGPVKGLALARMVGHITYLSDESMHAKFGRSLQGKDRIGFDFSTDFAVESYLHHQGDTFTKRFDANSYLYITKAIDYFDLTKDGSLTKGLAGVKAAIPRHLGLVRLALSALPVAGDRLGPDGKRTRGPVQRDPFELRA